MCRRLRLLSRPVPARVPVLARVLVTAPRRLLLPAPVLVPDIARLLRAGNVKNVNC